MLKEIGFMESQNGEPIIVEDHVEKVYMILTEAYEKMCFERDKQDLEQFKEMSYLDVSGVLISESSSMRSKALKIIFPTEADGVYRYDDCLLMSLAQRIISDLDYWGWDDTDPVAWSIRIDNGFHFAGQASIKIKLDDWAS